jgi:hypothetical protein
VLGEVRGQQLDHRTWQRRTQQGDQQRQPELRPAQPNQPIELADQGARQECPRQREPPDAAGPGLTRSGEPCAAVTRAPYLGRIMDGRL